VSDFARFIKEPHRVQALCIDNLVVMYDAPHMRRLVGRNVRRIPCECGMPREQFAELSGFSQQYISDLERGRRNPTIVLLFELAQALGSTPVELLAPGED